MNALPDELRALRERAYGPHADIHEDPAALARLRELEERHRLSQEIPAVPPKPPLPPVVPAAPAVTRAMDGPARGAAASAAPAPAASRPAPSAPAQAAPAPAQPRSLRSILTAAAAVGLAALVGAGVALGLTQLPLGGVASLAVAQDADWPDEFFGRNPGGGVVFEEYLGITVVSMPQQFSQGGGAEDCLFVLLRQRTNMATIGCSSEAFPGIASFTVTGTATGELLAVHPVGSSLQFVRDGDRVTVYARNP